MIGDYQRDRNLAKGVRTSSKLAQALVRTEQDLGCETAHGDDDCRLDQIYLFVKEWAALADFLPEGIAIVRRSTLEHIGDINVFARKANAGKHRAQQGARSTDEWQALFVLFCAWGFSDEKPAHDRLP